MINRSPNQICIRNGSLGPRRPKNTRTKTQSANDHQPATGIPSLRSRHDECVSQNVSPKMESFHKNPKLATSVKSME